MKRLGAIYAAIKKRTQKGPTKAQQELESWQRSDHTQIKDIDIRENTKTKLKFRKLPWAEFMISTMALLSALFLVCFMKVHGFEEELW